MRTAAILPVKRFSVAKQRLGASVAHGLRQELAAAMVADVLAALADAREIELTIVVTCETSVAEAAAEQGAIVIAERSESGQSAAVSLGIERALAEHSERAICIPGDCPSLGPEDLDGLLQAEGQPAVVIIPDRHGTGTNGLLLRPCDAIRPSFGPGSCERHLELALSSGLGCAIRRPRGLLLDIDTGEDLAALRERLAEEPARAPKTRAVLGDAGRFAGSAASTA
jgi:2-phospho-L-lactate guanylyltransferase